MLGPSTTVILVLVALLVSGIKVLREYERGVVMRLGRLVGARGPGIIYVIPWVETIRRIDLRTVTMDVPPQDVITRDNVSVKVSAVLYFRVMDPAKAIVEVENSALVKEALGEHIFNKFLENKKIEWDAYRMHVSNYEIERYLPIL